MSSPGGKFGLRKRCAREFISEVKKELYLHMSHKVKECGGQDRLAGSRWARGESLMYIEVGLAF